MTHYKTSRHKFAVSKIVNTKIWVHKSAYEPKRKLFRNPERRTFIFSSRGSAYASLLYVSDHDVPMKNKGLLFIPEHLRSMDSPHSLHQLPWERENLLRYG